MAAALPSTACGIALVHLPGGLPGPGRFTVTRGPLPVSGSGYVVVRDRYFLVFPGLRTLIGGQAVGVVLSRARTGDTLFGSRG